MSKKKMDKELIFDVSYERTGSTFRKHEIYDKCKTKEVISINMNPAYGKKYQMAILHGIRHLYGDVKIVIGVREKKKWMQSLYGLHIEGNEIQSFKKWKKNRINEKMMEFNEFVDEAKKIYSNVFIFHMKDFDVAGLLKFIGEDTHPDKTKRYHKGLKGPIIHIYRLLNYIKKIIGWLYGIRYHE